MRAEVFIDQSEGGVAEISVVRHGLSSGAARKYRTVEEAMTVLLVFAMTEGWLIVNSRPFQRCLHTYC